MTVAIEDESGLPIAYGVVANVSESGACVWTDGIIARSSRLRLRVSFAHLSEVHEVAAVVVWEGAENASRGAAMRRFGVEWLDASDSCVTRLRELALRESQGPLTPANPLAALLPPPGN
jgi:cyanate lyase